VKGTECGQISIAKKYEQYVEKMDKELAEGTCASKGYSHLDKDEKKDIPMVGPVDIKFFSKPTLAEDAVSLYQVEYGICAEASLDKKFKFIIDQIENVDKKL
jgi:hypothetical protein